MPYGTIKIDTITFTDGGVDKSVPVSGLVQNPTFTGNVTVTGTISGNIIQGGTTVSGLTVTGTTANFASGVFTTQISGVTITGTTVAATTGTFTSLTGTTTNGTTASFTTGNFTSLTGTTTTGTTANFASGVFTTQVSGLLITGPTVSATTGNFTSLTGTTTTGTTANFASGVFTTQISGVTITGTTISTTTGNFTSLTGTTATITSGIIASGTAALPSLAILSDPNTGIYSPGADQLAVATNGTQRLTVDTAATTSTLPVVHPLGAAATPSITFTGDLNTGIFSPGADQVAISTNGTGRLFVDATGNVGVGTASPGYALDIASADTSAGNALRLRHNATATAAGLQFTDAGATAQHGLITSDSSSNLKFSTGNTEKLRITSAGNVGIGTSSPGEKLTVAGNISLSAAQPYISFIDSIWGAGSTFRSGVNTLGTATGDYQLFNVPTGKGFAFAQNNATNSLVIDSSGNVGIGTTSPSRQLDVNSTAIFDSNGNGTTTSPSIAIGSSGVGFSYIGSQQLAFLTNSNERARIDSSGRLLVGTSSARSNLSPAGSSAQFQVEGANNDTNKISIISSFNSATAAVPAGIYLSRAGSTDVGSTTIVANNNGLGQIYFQGCDGTNFLPAASIVSEVDGTPGANDMPGRLVFSTTADGSASPTERMRIDSAGVLKVSNNNTYAAGSYHQFNQNASSQWTLGVLGRNATDPYGIRVEYTNAAPNGTVSQFLYCVDTAGVKAEIRSNGGLANYQANDVNLSDRNAKKDIAPAAGTWNCVKEWEIVNYHYKDQPDDADLNLGVIAQQVAESCPEVITVFQEATEDEPEKLGIKEQQMYWMAIKALQEAQIRIETLEAKVAGLEAQ